MITNSIQGVPSSAEATPDDLKTNAAAGSLLASHHLSHRSPTSSQSKMPPWHLGPNVSSNHRLSFPDSDQGVLPSNCGGLLTGYPVASGYCKHDFKMRDPCSRNYRSEGEDIWLAGKTANTTP